MSEIKVLVVEDEGLVARDLKRRLQRQGYRVVGIADNAAIALSLAQAARPDLVLMDIVIRGDADGIQTAARIRERQDIPVIFLTAHSDAATIQRAKPAAPYGYLIKPFEERELATTIEMALYRHQTDRHIRDQAASLRTLAQRLEAIREQERARIAREIHDVLAQGLTLMKLDLTWVAKRIGRPVDEDTRRALQGKIGELQGLVDTASQTVQRVATELRPVVLDSLGLPAAVEWQAREFQTRTGIRCHPHTESIPPVLDREQSVGLFRILQESLTNVARHAQATCVDLILHCEDGDLVLQVRDNGRGISTRQAGDPTAIGLLGMRERALLLGGRFEIQGQPGSGTVVTVRVPVCPPPANSHLLP